MSSEPTREVLVGAVSDIAIGAAVVVDGDVNGTGANIAVFHTDDDEFYAINDECPHAEASLAEGYLEGAEIECPLHAGTMCVKTGKATGLPIITDTVTHVVIVRDGQVWLIPNS
jgi:3-phenylpropionate/trans-cinnamate dioxygenase ferredoxin subunit